MILRFDSLPEGTQCRVARVAAGLTLFDVCVRAAVSPPRLSEFERGRSGHGFDADAVDRVKGVLNDALAKMGGEL